MATKFLFDEDEICKEDVSVDTLGYMLAFTGGPNSPTNKFRKLDFFMKYLVSNKSDKYGFNAPDLYVYSSKENDKFEGAEKVILDNIEYFMSNNYIPLWIIDDSIKDSLSILSADFVDTFVNYRKFYITPTIDAEVGYIYPIQYIDGFKSDISISLYRASITDNKYSDTIRRIFKFYGKECIWSYLQGCKIPDEYKATVAEIVSQVMDVFDNSERPDEWKPKMQSLLIETIQECLVIANKYITDNDDTLLESRLENLIKTAAKKYVELDKDDVVEETQQQSSSSEDKSQVIDAPQIGYDKEFNSTPKYDDLKAYDAFIKQQQQEIVESYLKGREERMKQNKTIDTVATVDSNGKITYNAKNISPLQLYMLDKVFYNKNIANILKQKINSPSFSLILIYNDTADDYKVLCFNDKNELLFHYIKNENIIYFSEENYR